MSFNFALILFWLLVITGVAWIAELAYFRKQRRRAADAAVATFDADRGRFSLQPEVRAIERQKLVDRNMRQPWWIEFPVGFFPVILIVFVLRSFLVEPFRIPSSSMVPTLLVGDLILVNKFDYGIRLPLLNKKILKVGDPERGDVMVFRYPLDPTTDYIKRVIGVPGDRVTYRNKRLEINGAAVPVSPLADYFHEDTVNFSQQFLEKLPGPPREVDHPILNDEARSPQITPFKFEFRGNCTYSENDTVVSCVVPPGHYFMMGDNRDNSEDSRYWGFVPDENIVGKAFFIWMNFGKIKRVGGIQ